MSWLVKHSFPSLLFLLIHASLQSHTTFHITQVTSQDEQLCSLMQPLLFEKQNTGFFDTIYKTLINPEADIDRRLDVQRRAIKEYGGALVNFVTDDNYRLSGLLFNRPQAKINIIYATGYLKGLTPTKEWAAPFSHIFADQTTFSFDWRGYGESESKGVPFGLHAVADIHAAVRFIRSLNNKPIVLVGFCFGAALCIKALHEAQQNNLPHADALVVNCAPAHMNDMKTRIADTMPWILNSLSHTTLVKDYVYEWLGGDVFTLSPCTLLPEITLPICFEHLSGDAVTPPEDLRTNRAACGTSYHHTLLSDIGSHVRIHAKVPHQYRQSFMQFARGAGLI